MSQFSSRRIFRSKVASQFEVSSLIESVFATELVLPSENIWIVSPWLSDIPVLENRDGAFSSLNENLPRDKILLAEVLARLVQAGSNVNIVMRDVDHNEYFDSRLTRQVDLLGGIERLSIRKTPVLHTKGILTENIFLSGSMNFTFNGIQILDEQVTIETAENLIAQAFVEFRQRYGSVE